MARTAGTRVFDVDDVGGCNESVLLQRAIASSKAADLAVMIPGWDRRFRSFFCEQNDEACGVFQWDRCKSFASPWTSLFDYVKLSGRVALWKEACSLHAPHTTDTVYAL